MSRFGSWLLFLLLPLTTLGIVGCGSSRQLQSVTLSPAWADAQNFPSGQVSFTATGTFSKKPSPLQLTSKDVTWCAGSSSGMCVGNINPGRYSGPEWVGTMRTGIHGNSYNSRGNGIFLCDESRRRLAAQDLRSRTLDVPLTLTFLGENHFT